VLVSVLIAAELGGLVGALLAIPVAGIVQILVREFVPAGQQAGSASAKAGGPTTVRAESRAHNAGHGSPPS
jgi:predicted PurR-regulated permease PerM